MTANTATSSPPLTSLPSLILTTGPFLFAWSLLRQYTTKNGPSRIASTLITINSQVYALFSALLSYLLIQSYLNTQHALPGQAAVVTLPLGLSIPYLNRTTLTIADLGLIYHYSKIYEYADVLLLVAQGKVIGQHMAFHHITTPFLTYFRVLNCSGTDWRVFALANAVHHTFMYAYFGGVGNWLRSVIPYTGWAQLILGLGVDGWWMFETKGGKEVSGHVLGGGRLDEREVRTNTGDETTNRGIAILLLTRYAMLFWQELKEGRAAMSKEQRERARAKQGQAQG